jgi:hypothetical protein
VAREIINAINAGPVPVFTETAHVSTKARGTQ